MAIVGHFETHQVKISRGICLPETAHFFYSRPNGLGSWHGFPNNTHIEDTSRPF